MLPILEGRISSCRACRSMKPALEPERGLPGEPHAGHDCVPCVCPMSTLSLSSRRSIHPHASRDVLRSELVKQAVRCAAVLEMWASTVAPGLLFRLRHSQRRAALDLGCSVRLPQPSGWALDRHSGSQPVIWCESLVRGAGCRRSISC